MFSGKCFHINPVKKIRTYANITLQITPAEMTIALCPTVLFEYLLGESAGKSQSSSSSGNETYPPSKKA